MKNSSSQIGKRVTFDKQVGKDINKVLWKQMHGSH